MPIISNWKITYDPAGAVLVIVDFGEAIEGEISFPWAQQIQGGSPTKSLASYNYARGAVRGGLSLTAIKDHADDKAARKWCLDLAIALAAVAGVNGKVLKLEAKGDTEYYELASATINSAEPAMRIAGVARTHTPWSIGGTIWSKVTPP